MNVSQMYGMPGRRGELRRTEDIVTRPVGDDAMVRVSVVGVGTFKIYVHGWDEINT